MPSSTIAAATAGDILVLMPGAYEIGRTVQEVQGKRALRDFVCFPLHGELPPEQQDRAVPRYDARKIIVSAGLHVYVSQTDRGEFLIGAEIEPYTTYSTRSTWTFIEQASANALELFPFLARQKIHRQWTGYCDMTPDYSPVMGVTGVDGFLLDSGWGTWGFKASPICGVTMAQLIATGKVPE